MRISKARRQNAATKNYFHVDPHSGAEFESPHKVLIFSDYPGDKPMPLEKAQKAVGGGDAKTDGPRQVRAPTPSSRPKAAPSKGSAAPSERTPKSGPTRPQGGAIRIRGADENVATRAWTPAASSAKADAASPWKKKEK